jgi:lia operon protein LiaF
MSVRRLVFGIILIIIGLWLWARAMEWIWWDFGDLLGFLLPIGLIVMGIWLMVRRKRQDDHIRATAELHQRQAETGSTSASAGSSSYASAQAPPPPPPPPPGQDQTQSQSTETGPSPGPEGRLKYSKGIGDIHIDCNGRDLHNVEVSMGIGDVEIRLHGGRLKKGLNRVIISGFIGDIRVYLPPDMPYFAHCSNAIGDIELAGRRASGFGNNLDGQSEEYESAEARLYIAANNFIGDIRVYRI